MFYLKLIRPLNLLLIIVMLVVFKYGFLAPLDIQVALGYLDFTLLVIATICIAAGGNVINDLYDVSIDTINKPERVIIGKHISDKHGNIFFIVLNVIGVGCGFLLANRLGKPSLAIIFIGVSALLYVYASYLKSVLLIGNIVISILVALVAILLIIFDILPAINTDNMNLQVTSAGVLLQYAGFAFVINLIREIVKDIQDVNGDKNGDRLTLPIAIGRKRAIKVVFALGALSVAGIIYYMYQVLYSHQTMASYFLILILAPMLFFCIKAWNAKKFKDFRLLSILLKGILFLGICSILFYPEIILN
jgi:4-hydroxybenzoate polyprenyltransferase